MVERGRGCVGVDLECNRVAGKVYLDGIHQLLLRVSATQPIHSLLRWWQPLMER